MQLSQRPNAARSIELLQSESRAHSVPFLGKAIPIRDRVVLHEPLLDQGSKRIAKFFFTHDWQALPTESSQR